MKHLLYFAIPVFVLLLAISLYLFASPLLGLNKTEPLPTYILKDNGGTLALFAPDKTEPVRTWNIYTYLLPEVDVLQLQAGIPVQTEEDLQRYIEDFGG
ncbi:MAG: hypothetical protein PHG02_02505 [Oscillospiraceae bacterium]|nr:hypothetical protein [Oscillospiraceae bacterium]